MTDANSAEAKAITSRRFLIGIMMTFLISISVFVVSSFYFLIPRLYDHEKRINELNTWIRVHQAEHNAANAPVAAAEPAPAEAPAAPAPDAAPAGEAAPAAK